MAVLNLNSQLVAKTLLPLNALPLDRACESGRWLQTIPLSVEIHLRAQQAVNGMEKNSASTPPYQVITPRSAAAASP
jgi:hypothetical protein